MTPKQATLLLLVMELAIPLLGYFFWSWDYSFILLFYAIDWIFFLGFQGVKIYQRLQLSPASDEKRYATKAVAIYFGVFCCCITAFTFLAYTIDPMFNFGERMIAFLRYEDMGLAQGYFLVPFCLFSAYTIYKREFVLPQIAQRFTLQQFLRNSVVQHVVLAVGTLIVACVFIAAHLSTDILLFTTIGLLFLGKCYFQLLKNQP